MTEPKRPYSPGPVHPEEAACKDRDEGRPCVVCAHEACGWCPECHPEVPEWD